MNKSNNIAKPKISVIMPVYNCDKYLEEALVSLIIQTYKDFEVIAINDGSTDNSLNILEKYAKFDSRIKIISQKNSGIVKALNNGIKASNGEYIARMDGDDISFPNRFTEQVRILDDNSDIVLVAGNFEVINEESEFIYKEVIVPDDDYIQRAFYLRNAVAHGSVMFRKSVVEKIGLYSEAFGPTEDMELWMRLTRAGKFSATGTSVYRWRVNQKGITSINNSESIKRAAQHIEKRWQDNEPELLSRKDIINKSKKYNLLFGDTGRHYTKLFLADICQIAIKYLKHGKKISGIKQMISLFLSGKCGTRTVLGRIKYIANNGINIIKI